ncbi:carboxylesterase/lipase family protein [Spongiactinospora rosea]|uniref:Carboxylic ester hydrolase n=1 Tax=Spongiactinospora rosea TaxID=2248750 RepID=A0A366M4C4_9ACTN|nr:carboxylesterase family protein [Spongiactinospora rosea]RBQ21031.1 carboxylesterase/lipase family protein [Spongiactinospora rosea]
MTGLRARVADGVLRGVRANGVTAFRGVPYAVPARRFGLPEPPEPWRGERDASRFGPPVAQRPGRMAWVPGLDLDPAEGDEGPLTLNVWTPGCDDARRPVLVFVHGGAFVSGSGAQPMYDGGPLARAHGLVVVTLNYRLGFLGFGHLPGVPANLGLRDQIAALRWVQHNAPAFGGDPARVTLAGHSAGATSVLALLTSPSTQNLYARAAILSAVPYGFTTPTQSLPLTEKVLGDVLGAVAGDGLLGVPLSALLAAEAAAMAACAPVAGLLPIAPVIDGELLPRHPMEAIRAGAAAPVPLLVSTTTEEMRLFAAIDPPTLPYSVARTEELFDGPAGEIARAHRGPVCRVRFTRPAPLTHRGVPLGACHLADVPFYLGTWRDRRMAALVGDGVTAPARAATAAFAAFCQGEDQPDFAGIPRLFG